MGALRPEALHGERLEINEGRIVVIRTVAGGGGGEGEGEEDRGSLIDGSSEMSHAVESQRRRFPRLGVPLLCLPQVPRIKSRARRQRQLSESGKDTTREKGFKTVRQNNSAAEETSSRRNHAGGKKDLKSKHIEQNI